MKTLLYLSIFAFLFRPVMAEPITLEWNANPVTEQVDGYRVYKIPESGPAQIIIETATLTGVADLELNDRIYFTAYRGVYESGFDVYVVSEIPTVPPLSKPAGFKITGSATFELKIEPIVPEE